MKYWVLFIVVLLAATFLRLYQLDKIPPSLNWDEISLGYNAYSILKTGQDEWGFKYPLNFRAYGDYKLPTYVYIDVPFIAIFGLNEWGVRLPSALAGLGIVILVYLIIKHHTNNKLLATGAMFIAAVTPWLIILSRIALEANLALFLTILSLYLFFIGLKNNKYLILSAIFFGLTFFTYNSSRVVGIPILILVFIIYLKKLKLNTYTVVSLLIIGVFFAITIPLALSQDSSARYNWTRIVDEGAIQEINQSRGHSSLPETWKKIIYNKVTYFIPHAFSNYISHFDPQFLFLKGGSNYQYSIPGQGLWYPITLVLLISGFLYCFKQKKNWQLFTIGLLLIAPIPAAITRDAPHALRTLFLNIPLLIISACGLKAIYEIFNKRLALILSGLILIAIVFSTIEFWIHYSTVYAKDYSWSWQYGYQQAIDYVSKSYPSENIYFTKKYGEPHEFVLFYTQYDPAKYRNNSDLIRYQKSDWFWVDQFDRYIFLNDWEVKEKTQDVKDGILITSPDNYPDRAVKLQTIYFKDQTPAFDIVKL